MFSCDSECVIERMQTFSYAPLKFKSNDLKLTATGFKYSRRDSCVRPYINSVPNTIDTD